MDDAVILQEDFLEIMSLKTRVSGQDLKKETFMQIVSGLAAATLTGAFEELQLRSCRVSRTCISWNWSPGNMFLVWTDT
jgi:hypothetical protein